MQDQQYSETIIGEGVPTRAYLIVTDGYAGVTIFETETGWVELSHPIDADTVRMPFLPRPETHKIPDAALRATEMTLATHVGTHIEAPRHRFPDGKGIDEYSPDRWITDGFVSEVVASSNAPIEREDITVPDSFERDDALLLRTGWEEHVGEEAYFDPPYISEALAAWIAERGPGWIGIDAPTPEIPDTIGATDSDYPIHSILFEHDVLVAENLTNLESLANEHVSLIALPLLYTGLDAAPARIVARPQ